MRRDVYWETVAVEDFWAISGQDRKTAKRILDAVRGFAADGRGDIKKLKDRDDEWRIRVGDWRIVFSLQGRVATVTAIDNRRDAY